MTDKIISRPRQDLTFKRCHMLIAVHYAGKGRWLCLCDCGEFTTITTGHFNEGRTKSCGCYGKAHRQTNSMKHGGCIHHPVEYKTWSGMRDRCNNPNSPAYKYYGGKGVSICSRWDDFTLFLLDMGKRPSKKHSIDRKDSSGNYEPSNCHWATPIQQLSNRSSCNQVLYEGETYTHSALARKLGIPRNTLVYRLNRSGGVVDSTVLNRVQSENVCRFIY